MKNKLLKNKKVAIIGAGPVGLTTAKLLQDQGVHVVVYERDINEHARISGGTLDIHRNTGQKALKKANLLEAFYEMSRPTGERATDINGHIIMQEYPKADCLYDRPEIDRYDLRKILLNSVQPNTVVWNKKMSSLTKDQDQWIVNFEDGSYIVADLVIGANGGRSKVRSYITESQPKYTGTFIIQGEVYHPDVFCPQYKKLCENDNLMVLGADKKMLFSQVKSEGAINYYLSFRAKENFLSEKKLNINNRKQIIECISTMCSNWDSRYKELFSATNSFSALPMKQMPLENEWSSDGGLTLMGDAAHLMPPYAGIGVNIGLLDALYLSENLTEGTFSSIREALDDYEKKMFMYASEAQRETSLAEDGLFSEESIEEQLQSRNDWNQKLSRI